VDWQTKSLRVALTRKQIENSPDINTHRPVSRQHEAELSAYYGYSPYWGGPFLWGSAYYPADLSIPTNALTKAKEESADSHLRSSTAVTRYHVEAEDGEMGHVEGFVIDDKFWSVRYVEIATRNWLPGKKVLISAAWIERVSWPESKIYAGLFRERIQDAPGRSHESTKVACISTMDVHPIGRRKSKFRSTVPGGPYDEPRIRMDGRKGVDLDGDCRTGRGSALCSHEQSVQQIILNSRLICE
jgi:hypothetical protein